MSKMGCQINIHSRVYPLVKKLMEGLAFILYHDHWGSTEDPAVISSCHAIPHKREDAAQGVDKCWTTDNNKRYWLIRLMES